MQAGTLMKAYLVVTGVAFMLLVAAHVARIVVEGWHVAGSPAFIISTFVAVAMCVWAACLYRRLSSRAPPAG